MKVTKKDVGYFARIIGVLLVITMCVALLLSAVNMITKDKIAANEKAKLENAIGELFKGITPTTEKLSVSTDDETLVSFNLVKNGDAPVGFYAEVLPTGFKGTVSMLVGLTLDGKVTGIQILTHGETVGIGDKIEEDSFLDGFNGISSAGEADGIDVITGATYSSKAVKNGVKVAINAYSAYKGGAAQ